MEYFANNGRSLGAKDGISCYHWKVLRSQGWNIILTMEGFEEPRMGYPAINGSCSGAKVGISC